MSREKDNYVKSFDNTPIWFRQIGDSGPCLVLCDGVGCEGYVWKYLIRDFAAEHRIVHWNYRGHGKTPLPKKVANIGIEINVRDLAVILDHLGIKDQVIVIGHSMGVQVILEFYHQYPKRVKALVALTGPYGRALETLYGSPIPKLVFPYVKQVFERYPAISRAIWRKVIHSEIGYQYAIWFELNRHLLKREDFFPYLKALSCMDPIAFLRSLEAATAHSAETYLADIKVPTLVIASEKDRFTPFWVSEEMAKKIPGAEFLAIPTGSHTGPIELPDLVNLRIEKFLKQVFEKHPRRTRKKKA